MGRPELEIDQEICKKAEDLAACGLNLKEIAAVLGMHRDTLNEKKKEFSDFSDAIALGKSKGVAVIKNKFFEKAKDGDNHCMTLYLKNHSDLRDKQEVDVAGGFNLTILKEDANNA